MIDSIAPDQMAALQETSPEAERGTRIHKARELGNPTGLHDESELKAYERGVELEGYSVDGWCRQFDIVELKEQERELRLWMHSNSLAPELSGKLDRHWIGTDCHGRVLVLIMDDKTGVAFHKESYIWQGKVQSVLSHAEYSAVHVRFALNKMEVGGGVVDVVDYDSAQLVTARREIITHLDESKLPTAETRAGDHCDFCPAKAFCKAAIAYAKSPMTLAKADDLAVLKGRELAQEVAKRVDQMPLSQVAELRRRSRVINAILDAASKRLKAAGEVELAEVGLSLKPGRKLDYIAPESVRKACEILESNGVPEQDIWPLLELSKTRTVEYVMQAKNLSNDAAGKWYDAAMADVITPDRGENQLVEKD